MEVGLHGGGVRWSSPPSSYRYSRIVIAVLTMIVLAGTACTASPTAMPELIDIVPTASGGNDPSVPPAVVGATSVPVAPDPDHPLAVGTIDSAMVSISGRVTRRGIDGEVWDADRRIGMLTWVSWGWQPNTDTDGTVWAVVINGGRPGGAVMVSRDIFVRTDIGRVQGAMIPNPARPAYPIAVVWFGDGTVRRGTIYEVVSDDLGMTWSEPRPVAEGSIHALWGDRDGTLHAVRIGPQSITDRVWYGIRRASEPAWQWELVPSPISLTLVDADIHPETGMVLLVGMSDRPGPGSGYSLVVALRDRTGTWTVRTRTDARAIGSARPLTVAWCTPHTWIAGWTSYGTSVVAAAWSDDGTIDSARITVVAAGAGREPRRTDLFTEDVTVICDPIRDREMVIWSTRWDTIPRRWPQPRHTEVAWRDRSTDTWIGIDTESAPSTIPVLDASRTVMAFSGWVWYPTSLRDSDRGIPSVRATRSPVVLAVSIDHTNATWNLYWEWVAPDTIGYPARS